MVVIQVQILSELNFTADYNQINMRWLLLGIFFFVLLPYEIIGINEDFLFIISFSIFFYNLVGAVSSYAFVELEARRSFVRSLFENLLDFRRLQSTRLNAFFDYSKFQDLENGFFTAIALLLNQLGYRFYLNNWLETTPSLVLNSTELEYALFKSNLTIESEEYCYALFGQN